MKTGIALAGGGSKGSYQTGAWKALRELGIDYDIVTGTSIGAINGALMVMLRPSVISQPWPQEAVTVAPLA